MLYNLLSNVTNVNLFCKALLRIIITHCTFILYFALYFLLNILSASLTPCPLMNHHLSIPGFPASRNQSQSFFPSPSFSPRSLPVAFCMFAIVNRFQSPTTNQLNQTTMHRKHQSLIYRKSPIPIVPFIPPHFYQAVSWKICVSMEATM